MSCKYGMISSFNILCGNATYSEFLCQGIEESIQAKVSRIDLGLTIQKFTDDKRIELIIEKIKDLDYLNFQFEMGLYGHTPWNARKNLEKILRAYSGKGSVCLHRFDCNLIAIGYLKYIRAELNRAKSLPIRKKILLFFKKTMQYEESKIVEANYFEIAKLFYRKGFKFIVHTIREERSLKRFFPEANIVVHPIFWPNLKTSTKTSSDLPISFKNNLPIVGLFGFISDYKNYDVILECLRQYKNFNVLIVGSQHPQNFAYGKKTQSYVLNLNDKITEIPETNGIAKNNCTNLTDYVVWRSWMTDEELIQLASYVDVVAVPYFETGQSGSGIASIAIQFGKAVMFSDTKMTAELERFTDAPIPKFDVVSTVAVSYALTEALSVKKPNFKKEYTFKSNVLNYVPT